MHVTNTLLPCLLSFAQLLTVGFASPLSKSAITKPRLIPRQNSSSFPITGIQNGVQPRIEIRQMYANTDQWNVFLLGMVKFQQSVQTDMLSYYGIAGIHGVPNDAWDGVQANPANDGRAIGYCTHSSVLFPSWHRPYMALFEQTLYQYIQDAANEFTDPDQRQRYQAAASTWRLPYWEYGPIPPGGLDLPTLPRILNSYTQLNVTTPSGPQLIDNPLKRYDFNPLVPSDMILSPWNTWNTTKRWPTSSTSPDALSQNELAQNALDQNRLTLRDNIYNLFTLCPSYLEFSNDASGSTTPGCHVSLEGIHDSIHTLTGGAKKGHMTWLWWAAFDPIFYFHHANIDRLFALWSAVYPDQTIPNAVANGSTFTIAQGTEIGGTSDLTPFHKDSSGNFWTPDDVTDVTTFGYTYPELVSTNGDAGQIMSIINDLYGPEATGTSGSEKKKREAFPEPKPTSSPSPSPSPTKASDDKLHLPSLTWDIPGLASILDHPTAIPSLISKFDKIIDGKHARYEWICNIKALRFGLNGPFTVFIFMGDEFDENPQNWPFAESFVGSQGFFSQSGMKGMDISVAGAVPLTRALTFKINKGILGEMEALAVTPYLQQNLHWRVADADGNSVPPENVPGLSVGVVMGLQFHRKDETSFPQLAQAFETLYDITSGKPGGVKKDD